MVHLDLGFFWISQTKNLGFDRGELRQLWFSYKHTSNCHHFVDELMHFYKYVKRFDVSSAVQEIYQEQPALRKIRIGTTAYQHKSKSKTSPKVLSVGCQTSWGDCTEEVYDLRLFFFILYEKFHCW